MKIYDSDVEPRKPLEFNKIKSAFDETRTQWFCCEKQPPVHNGIYEIRAKPARLPKILEVRKISFDSNRGIYAWDGYPGWMMNYEWRGLAVKP